MKKLFFLLVVLIILAGAGYAAYSFWWIPSQEDDVNQNQTGLIQITTMPVVSPVNAYTSNAVWYGLKTGKLMRYGVNDGQTTEYPLPQISSGIFSQIHWPRNGSDFIAQSVAPTGREFYYFDSTNQTYVKLPANIIALDWLSSGLQIVVIWKSGDGKTYLVVSNPDASGYRIVRELPWSDLLPHGSPKDNVALLLRQNSNAPTNKIYLFDLQTGEYTEVVTSGRSTGVRWSPTGNGFAYTQIEEGKNKVYYHNLATGKLQSMGLIADIDKVAFNQDGSKLYIASSRSDQTGEDIWEYDFATDIAQIKYAIEGTSQIKNLIVDGQKIFFMGSGDNLYMYSK